jgi:hypothetical protein
MQLTPTRRLIVAVLTLVVLTGGCAAPAPKTPAPPTPGPTPAALWPRPVNAKERTAAAGLKLEDREHIENHVHAHLDVFVDGQRIVVAAGIGINIDDPDVRQFRLPDGSTAYGGIKVCGAPCISPLHTHDETGILHTESATLRAEHARPVLRRVGRDPQLLLRRRLLQPEAARVLHQRHAVHRRSTCDRAVRPTGDCDRHRHATRRDPGNGRLLAGVGATAARARGRLTRSACRPCRGRRWCRTSDRDRGRRP